MSRTTTEMPLSTNSLNFVGFKAITDRTDGSPTYTACTAGSTFGTSSTYHKCCGTVEPCSFATTCIENIYATLIYEAPDGSSSINRCPFGKCQAATLLPSTDAASSEALIRYFCLDSTEVWPYPTMFRADPAAKGIVGPASITGTTGDANAPAALDNTTTDDNMKGKDGGKKDDGSKAWIAGAVIGPLIFLALLALGFFLLARRRRRKRAMMDSDHTKAPLYMNADSNDHDSDEKPHATHAAAAKYGDPGMSAELEHVQSPVAEMDERQGPLPELGDTQKGGNVYELESPVEERGSGMGSASEVLTAKDDVEPPSAIDKAEAPKKTDELFLESAAK